MRTLHGHVARPLHALRRSRGADLGKVSPDHVEAADDDGEQIVEVVSDTAGELADRLHLLRLAQKLLGLAAGLVLGFEFTRAVAHGIFQRLGESPELYRGALSGR